MAPRKRSAVDEVEESSSIQTTKKLKTETPSPTLKTKTKPIIITKIKTKAVAVKPKQANVDEFGVYVMKVSEIKEKLKERDLSTNGDKKVLSKRLTERLVKEKDPTYKPKPKGRFCQECVVPTLMQKKNGVRGPFFGCSNYPQCMYTENRGSMAMLGKPKWFDINSPR